MYSVGMMYIAYDKKYTIYIYFHFYSQISFVTLGLICLTAVVLAVPSVHEIRSAIDQAKEISRNKREIEGRSTSDG